KQRSKIGNKQDWQLSRNYFVKEIDQNLTLFVSWKDLRRLYSDQSLINGPRKLRQLCQ
uniref:Uncharacterized protein n=1 Tax=Aegilops tauschii subsp. strangulata TaxID=200361 RepID=A0A453GUU9_AEGTS